MENKYYTPTIEEFHVGFEYEVLALPGDEWVKVKLTKDNFYLNIDRVLNHIDQCRVKYIDKEDIESLGYECLLGSPKRYEYKDYMMYNFNKYNVFTIKIKRSFSKYGEVFVSFDVLFEGSIKNKSELIKIMKQLNIK